MLICRCVGSSGWCSTVQQTKDLRFNLSNLLVLSQLQSFGDYTNSFFDEFPFNYSSTMSFSSVLLLQWTSLQSFFFFNERLSNPSLSSMNFSPILLLLQWVSLQVFFFSMNSSPPSINLSNLIPPRWNSLRFFSFFNVLFISSTSPTNSFWIFSFLQWMSLQFLSLSYKLLLDSSPSSIHLYSSPLFLRRR